jgi:hypothetical protein
MSFYTEQQIETLTENAEITYLAKAQVIATIWESGIDKVRENNIIDEMKKAKAMIDVCNSPIATIEQKNDAIDELGRLGYTSGATAGYSVGYVSNYTNL